MGVEFLGNEMPSDGTDDFHLSDAVVSSTISEVLDSVAMASGSIAQEDKDRYNSWVSLIEPQNWDQDQEALLVVSLRALSAVVYKIQINFHGSLLANVFSLSVWDFGPLARDALLDLIVSLAAVPDKFLDDCLHMLVNNFVPPKGKNLDYHLKWMARKRIHSELQRALLDISHMVPLAPLKLKDIIDKRIPRYTAVKEVIMPFVECILELEKSEIGEFLGGALLAKVVEVLTDLDVAINWEDILLDEHTKGVFEIELDDMEEDVNIVGMTGKKIVEESQALKGNMFADKLDCLMLITCEHLKECASEGLLVKVFETLLESFRKTVMNAYKSKFTQFLIFYACSLSPEVCGLKFVVLLEGIFLSKEEDLNSRMSAVCYLASYLSRAKFISASHVSSILKRLVDWCYEYCQFCGHKAVATNPKGHQVFYSGFQAVMYILCFHMSSLMDLPHFKASLLKPLQSILCHPLDPLKVCLPSIVQEFLRQSKAAHLFKTHPFFYDMVIDSEFSNAYGGKELLEAFFPFDPYLLKESDRFIRPNFKFWSMVNATYSNCNSDDEEFKDLDDPDMGADLDPMGDFHDNLDSEEEEEEEEDDVELQFSMNKMSITPKLVSEFAMAARDLPSISSRMPARIRPSVSP